LLGSNTERVAPAPLLGTEKATPLLGTERAAPAPL